MAVTAWEKSSSKIFTCFMLAMVCTILTDIVEIFVSSKEEHFFAPWWGGFFLILLRIEKESFYRKKNLFFFTQIFFFIIFQKIKNPPHHGANNALLHNLQKFQPNLLKFKGTNLGQRKTCSDFEVALLSSCYSHRDACRWLGAELLLRKCHKLRLHNYM